MKLSDPDAVAVPDGHFIASRRVAEAGHLPACLPCEAPLPAQLAMTDDAALDASLMDAHLARQETGWARGALRAMRRLKAGAVWIDRHGRADDFVPTTGGWLKPGIGKDLGHPSMAALPRFKSVPIDRVSCAVMGRQAPLSGPPHTLPPSPLQTTASCRQTVQNPTP